LLRAQRIVERHNGGILGIRHKRMGLLLFLGTAPGLAAGILRPLQFVGNDRQ
jgi:hypothetical protein